MNNTCVVKDNVFILQGLFYITVVNNECLLFTGQTSYRIFAWLYHKAEVEIIRFYCEERNTSSLAKTIRFYAEKSTKQWNDDNQYPDYDLNKEFFRTLYTFSIANMNHLHDQNRYNA